MISTFRYLAKTTGMALIVVGLAMLPAIAVSVIYDEFAIATGFIKVCPFSLAAGLLLYKGIRHGFDRIRISDGLLMVIWGWAAAVGALPFLFTDFTASYIDAFFEACSGFTTTNATTALSVEAMPYGLVFWRAIMSWAGGIGILLIAIAFFPTLGLSGQSIISTETEGPVVERPTPRTKRLAMTLSGIYLGLTLCEVLLLCLGGMSVFDSVIHSFGSVSSGGFSNYDNSIAHFDSAYIKAVMSIFMFLCGVNFNLYYHSIRRGLRSITGDSEFRLYLILIFLPAAIIFAELFFRGYYHDITPAVADSMFQTVSMLTTTGFTISDYEFWPQLCQVVILTLMVIGACSSSVGGGTKVIRFVIASRLMSHGIAMRLHPQYYEAIKVNKNSVSPDIVSGVANYIFLFIIVIFTGTIAVSFDTDDMTTAFTSVVSCVCNVGPAFGEAGFSGCYAGFSGYAKILLSVLMIAGRLELYTFFILFSPQYWTQKY
ncbi:MAG: TrkH family potassium uptake protein [Bacillota bacterium]|nr:TrkH family potassium uptake protein [Bacillota bacterium]